MLSTIRKRNTISMLFVWIMAMIVSQYTSYGFSSVRIPMIVSSSSTTTGSSSSSSLFAGVEAPTREDVDTDRKTGNNPNELGPMNDDEELSLEEQIRRNGPLEYLEDDPTMERNMEDPFHILLLDSTFEKPKITIPYVSASLNYVLDMPYDEATELTQFCYDNGMSCLGTWPREECLTLGRQLQVRDIVCRVVPYCEGGHRGWQAKDASDSSSSSSNNGRFIE